MVFNSQNVTGQWCDECGGHTHIPFCSKYVEPTKEPAEQTEPMDRQAAIKPTGDGAGGREWRYVETTFTAKVVAGDVELLPHWSGPARPNEIRAVVRKAAAALALYEALRGLRRVNHKCFCVTWVGGEHEPECETARAALALVDDPTSEDTNV